MKVYPINGELWTFRVESATEPGISYHVDLEEYDSNGFCDCMNFRTKQTKRLKQFGNWPRRRCKHIKLARDFALDRDIRMHPSKKSNEDERLQSKP